jgi:hypothetical protein
MESFMLLQLVGHAQSSYSFRGNVWRRLKRNRKETAEPRLQHRCIRHAVIKHIERYVHTLVRELMTNSAEEHHAHCPLRYLHGRPPPQCRSEQRFSVGRAPIACKVLPPWPTIVGWLRGVCRPPSTDRQGSFRTLVFEYSSVVHV